MKMTRSQTAVYWEPLSFDSFGHRTFTAPVEVAVRWQDKNELFMNKQGKEEVSSSIVYPAISVLAGGYLALTTLSELSTAQKADPRLFAGAKEIKSSGSSPNLKATQFIYKAWL